MIVVPGTQPRRLDEASIAFLRVRLEEVEDNDDPSQRVPHDVDAQRLILDAFEAALVDDSPTRAPAGSTAGGTPPGDGVGRSPVRRPTNSPKWSSLALALVALFALTGASAGGCGQSSSSGTGEGRTSGKKMVPQYDTRFVNGRV